MPLPFSRSIDHANARSDHCIGITVIIAVSVELCSASDFGISSPTIIASVVSSSSTIAADVDCASSGDRPASRSSHGAKRGAIDAWA